MRPISSLSGLLLGFFLVRSVLAQSELPASVNEALLKANLPAEAMAIWVEPVANPSSVPSPPLPPLIRSSLADQPRIPASTMKLVTTMLALDELGPTFRWKTAILSDGELKGSTLRGKLYLRGGGDPNLGWDKLSLMLRALRSQGIKSIAGDIVLDRSYFQPSRLDIDAQAFDEAPDAYYNVIPDALLVYSNLIDFDIESTSRQLTVQISPPMQQIRVENHLALVDGNCAAWDAGWRAPSIETNGAGALNIVLSGNFPRRCKAVFALNALERNLYIEKVIQALWRELGGHWDGKVSEGITPPSAKLLLEHPSDTLADTIRMVNKHSDNVMARLLYLTLGAEQMKNGSYDTTLEAANARTIAWFERHGINSEGMVLENGSGLSRLERISPMQMAGVLRVAAHSNWFPEFASSLPIAAVDGTMRKRLRGTSAEGRARIKTGSLKNAVAVAGYVRDTRDENWIVVGMVNHDDAPKGKAALDELLSWVANGGAQQMAKPVR